MLPSNLSSFLEFLNNDRVRTAAGQYATSQEAFKDAAIRMARCCRELGFANDKLDEIQHDQILAKLLQSQSDGTNVLAPRFVDFLNRVARLHEVAAVDSKSFAKCEVKTQENNIDIYPEGETHTILIENKINCAKDQRAQVCSYCRWLNCNRKPVAAVVYLTPRGQKRPISFEGWQSDDFNFLNLLVPVAAFLNGGPNALPDLVSGWLMPCADDPSVNKETRAMSKAYAELLKIARSPREDVVSTAPINDLLNHLLADTTAFQTAKELREMLERLPDALRHRFEATIGLPRPFGQSLKMPPDDYVIFWDQFKPFGYQDERAHLGLGIRFNWANRKYTVELVERNEANKNIVERVLEVANLLREFPGEVRDGRSRAFDFSTEGERDLMNFVKWIMGGLHKHRGDIEAELKKATDCCQGDR